MKKNNKVKEYVKDHKMQFCIGGGILLVGGCFIFKKIGDRKVSSTTNWKLIDEKVFTDPTIWKLIDEEVFTDIAPQIEGALLDSGIDTFHLDRSFEVEDGVFKTIKVVMETTKN